MFRSDLDKALAYADGSKGGRPLLDAVLMFKILVIRCEAVCLALSNGLSRERIAEELGIGSSTLKTWIREARKADTVMSDATDHAALLRENERLRRENPLLQEERELLKKATQFFASQRS